VASEANHLAARFRQAVASVDWYAHVVAKRPQVFGILRSLRAEQKMTPAQWAECITQRLRRLLCAAQEHVPYYRKIFRFHGFDARTAKLPDDLRRIPLLTKKIVRCQTAALINEKLSISQLKENATGGSTGEPLRFYQDRWYWTVSQALDAFVREWWGIRPCDATAYVWGCDRDISNANWRTRLHIWVRGDIILNAFRMRAEDMKQFAATVARRRPPYLMGYASALEAFARYTQEHRLPAFGFRAIRSTAETLVPAQRQIIEQSLAGPVYNFYGSREVNNLAAECPEYGKLHLISSWRYVEIVDRQGRPMPPGTPGHVAVTDLSNFGMPFIRYLNEDIAVLDPNCCPCGRPTPVLRTLLGRQTDIVSTPDGQLVHGEFFTHLFYGQADIKQFLVHQTAPDRLIVWYVPQSVRAASTMSSILEKIRSHMGRDVEVEARKCENIPLSPSGKRRFTRSDVVPPLARNA